MPDVGGLGYWMSGMLCGGLVDVRDAADTGMLGMLRIRTGMLRSQA